jgi:hypothetical protein
MAVRDKRSDGGAQAGGLRVERVAPRQRLRRAARAVGLSLLALLAVAGSGYGGWRYWFLHRAQPTEARETLFRGVEYRRLVRHSPRPLVIHLVRIDLRTPGLRFRVTPSGEGTPELPLVARTTSDYLKRTGAQLAINGDFFYPWYSRALWDYYPHAGDPVSVRGEACSDGDCYVKDTARVPSLFLSRNNRAFIGQGPPAAAILRYNVLSGNRLLLQDGKPIGVPGGDLHPRTAAGLDRTGRYLFLVVVDGRQPNYSEGMSEYELAELFRAEGASAALNLDGGGSATMAVRPRPDAPVSFLNCPIDNSIPGRERLVANHLAVWAPPLH